MPMEDAIAIEDRGRRILLKWHKLRRQAGEPPFNPENLRAGLRAGASLEVDIQVLADDEWVCLHDDLLDFETNGHGRVAEASSSDVSRLRIADANYAPPPLPEVANEAAAAGPSQAVLQFDLKASRDRLSEKAVTRFTNLVRPIASRCILSGSDWEAVQKLGSALPSLALGFDPLDLDASFTDAAGAEAFVSHVAEIATGARTFYLDRALVARALSFAVNPISELKRLCAGATVDVWTLDPETPGVKRTLHLAVSAGADQITTNAPRDLAEVWQRLQSG